MAHSHSRAPGLPIARAWVLLLFVAGCLSTAQAQVTNYTVTVSPGYNAIANHLVRGQNTVQELFPNVPVGTRLYKWDPAAQAFLPPAEFLATGAWQNSTDPRGNILRPGEGAFLYCPQSSTLNFAGSVATYPLPRQSSPAYNLVSAQLPKTMLFPEVFGFQPLPGDFVYLYNTAFGGTINNAFQSPATIHRFLATGWDNEPRFTLGRSAFVYLSQAPRITRQPIGLTVSANQDVRFEVEALGAAPLTYQWQFREDDIPNANQSGLVLNNVQIWNAGDYAVVVKNSYGEVISKSAFLRVLSPPVILKQPQSMKAIPGQEVRFVVDAVGSPTLRYQWYRNQQTVAGATEPMLILKNVSPSDAGQYFVHIKNDYGELDSRPATLAVNIPPIIFTQPRSVLVKTNERVTFFVEAGGTQPLQYQWRLNGRAIRGGTNVWLTISNVQPQHAGSYQVTVANIAGAVESAPAILKLDIPQIPFADDIKDAVLFTEPTFCGGGDNFNATAEPGEPGHAGRDPASSVWIRWRASQRGIVKFTTVGSSFDTVLAAYAISTRGDLIGIASDDDKGSNFTSQISFNADPEAIYYIVVDGVDGARGQIVLCWNLEPTTEILPVIVQEPIDQVPFSDIVRFDVGVTGDDLRYQWFFNGTPLANAIGSSLSITKPGIENIGNYLVKVFQNSRLIESRLATLQFSHLGIDNVPTNKFARDKFADAVVRPVTRGGGLAPSELEESAEGNGASSVVLGYTGTQIFSTVGFGTEDGEISHCGIPGGASAWFVFQAPANGTLYLNTDGSDFNTVLAIYTGPGPLLSSLTAVACDNNSGANGLTSSLSINASSNTIYYIAVDGVNGATGLAYLNYRLLVPTVLTRVAKMNESTLRFRITTTPSYPFSIQRSGSLLSWATLVVTNTPTGTMVLQDTNATPAKRYYRAVQTP